MLLTGNSYSGMSFFGVFSPRPVSQAVSGQRRLRVYVLGCEKDLLTSEHLLLFVTQRFETNV